MRRDTNHGGAASLIAPQTEGEQMKTTFAHAFAAVLWAGLAWYTSELIKPLFPDEINLGYYSEFNAFVGLLMGWNIAGNAARTNWPAALSYGWTTTFFTVLVALFLQCFGQMIRNSYKRYYDNALEALTAVFELMIEFAPIMLDAEVIGTLVIGGALGGLATEFVARRSR